MISLFLKSLIIAGVMMMVHLPGNSQSLDSIGFALPTDNEIETRLRERVDILKKSVGMVVGIVTPTSRKVYKHGTIDKKTFKPVDARTIFEIGGLTRIFTNLLLADMVVRGEVKLDDPLNDYLPVKARIPVSNHLQIRLIDLATQTSGLPYLPDKVRPGDSTFNGGMMDSQLFPWLSKFKVPGNVGKQWAYSDLGTGLLARALCYRRRVSFDSLLQERILGPLNMVDTRVHLLKLQKLRLAQGHNELLEPAPAWTMPSLEGARSIRSSVADLIKLLEAFTGVTKTSLEPAIKLMLETQRPGPSMSQGMGWLITISSSNGGLLATAGGETYGFSSFMSFNKQTQTGVVVLSNCSEGHGGLGLSIVK